MQKKKWTQKNKAVCSAALLLAAAMLSSCGGQGTETTAASKASTVATSPAAAETSAGAAGKIAADQNAGNLDSAAADKNAETAGSANPETGADSAGKTVEAINTAADEFSSKSTELFAMDTVMTLTAYGPNAQAGLDAAAAEIQRLDQLFSISSESGDIFRVNRDGSGTLSADSASLLQSALNFAAETGGLFEPTIEPVMQAWGFTTKNYRVPSDEELKELLTHVDYRKVSLSDAKVSLPQGMQLDLGGIAKGFTSARVMDVFRKAGVSSGIISLGGNVQALGTKPDKSPWRVGIQDPNNLNDTFAVVEVADEAVITSGAYQRFFEQDGKTYHHIIDPRTGRPADSGLTSVSIISKDGTLADALSTSLFVMGADAAAEFWKAHRDEFDTIMMDKDGTVYVTAGLANRCTVTGGSNVVVLQ